MKRIAFIGLITLVCSYGQAKSSEVMGMIARCSCSESTIDGERELGKFNSEKAFKTDKGARGSVYSQCAKQSDGFVSVINCQYIKVVDQKNGKSIKRRVENIKDEEENNLHNDLISTL